MADSSEEFICEQMVPAPGSGDAAAMARGEPGLPQRFAWRGREYRVVGVVEKWKSSGPCKSGANEMYLRRHWYKIITDPRAVLTVYCDRQAANRRKPKLRWWVYTAEIET